MICNSRNRWNDRIKADPYERFLITDLLGRLGTGLNDLAWESGLRFVQIPAVATYSSMLSEGYPSDAQMLSEIDERLYVQAAFSHQSYYIYFRVGSRAVIAHELGHCVDKMLNGFGSTATELAPQPKRSELVSCYALRGDSSERFAESFAAYINADPPRYSIDHLRRTDRSAAAALHIIFRGANGADDASARL